MAFFSNFFTTMGNSFKAFFGDSNKDRILKTGKRAEAKILSVSESKVGYVTVNEQPYVVLELEIFPEEGGPSFKTELQTVIPRLLVPVFQVGNVIYVKIDPEDSKKVVLDTTRAQNDLPVVGNKDEQIGEGGPKGLAEVLGIEKTDKNKNGIHVYLVNLKITGEGIETYTFKKEIPLPEYAFKFFIVGKKFTCKVDPIDKTKVDMDVK